MQSSLCIYHTHSLHINMAFIITIKSKLCILFYFFFWELSISSNNIQWTQYFHHIMLLILLYCCMLTSYKYMWSYCKRCFGTNKTVYFNDNLQFFYSMQFLKLYRIPCNGCFNLQLFLIAVKKVKRCNIYDISLETA